MTTDIQPFAYEGDDVRVVIIDGEPWFVAADVANILGYRMASDMTRRLDPDERGTRPVRTPSGEQDMTVISEAGLYEAIMGSRVPQAQEFKRWLKREVLPAIRRTGSYGTAPALTGPELMATALLEAKRLLDAKDERIAELEPAAQNWADFADAEGTYDLNATAKTLGTGRTILMRWMRREHILNLDNTPRQAHLDTGRFVVKVTHWTRNDGVAQVARSTRVTAKGLEWLASQWRIGGAA